MSLNQIIDVTDVVNRKYLNVKFNNTNILGDLLFDGDPGEDQQYVKNVGGVPTWVDPPVVSGGDPNTYLVTDNTSTVVWKSLKDYMTVFSLDPDVDLGENAFAPLPYTTSRYSTTIVEESAGIIKTILNGTYQIDVNIQIAQASANPGQLNCQVLKNNVAISSDDYISTEENLIFTLYMDCVNGDEITIQTKGIALLQPLKAKDVISNICYKFIG